MADYLEPVPAREPVTDRATLVLTPVYVRWLDQLRRQALAGGSGGGTVPVSGITPVDSPRLLGRSSGGSGPAEQLTVGTGLLLSGGVLSNTGVPGPAGPEGPQGDPGPPGPQGPIGTDAYWTRIAVDSSLLLNLVAYWALEEASGARGDATGRGHTLLPTGTPTGTTGQVGQAVSLTSTNWLSAATTPDLQTGDVDFTLGVWVRFGSVSNDADVLGKWGSGGQLEYALYINSSTQLTFLVSSTGSDVIAVAAPGTVLAGGWYFVVAWHDRTANTINLQVNDGAVTSTAHSAGVFVSTAPLVLGHSDFNTPPPLLLDELGLWKRVLTAAERTALYNAGAGVTYPFTGVLGALPTLTPTTLTDRLVLAAAGGGTQERLEVDGALKLGTTSGTTDGTVRYTGTDFEGRLGGAWVSLTQQIPAALWPIAQTQVTVTATNGASVLTAAGLAPVGSRLLAVTTQVTVAFSTANGLSALLLGDSVAVDRWGRQETLTAGAVTSAGDMRSDTQPVVRTAPYAVLVSAEGGAFSTTGTLVLTCTYATVAAP